MRIALKVGSVYYPLAGETGVDERVHSSAAEWNHGAAIASQEMPRVRALYSGDTDRKNLKHDLTFSTTRKFASPAEAALYDLDYEETVPRSGVLVIDAVHPDGGVSRRLMAGALVYPPARRLTGCTLFLDYRVTGGVITDGGYFPTAPVQAMQFWIDEFTQLGGNLTEAGPVNGKNVWSSDGQTTRTGLAAWRALVYSGTEWEHLSYTLGIEGSSIFPSSGGSEATPDLAAWPDGTFVLSVII